MKTVVLLSHHFLPEPNGTAVRVYELSKQLSRVYRVIVLCPPPTFPFSTFARSTKVVKKEGMSNILLMRLWTFQPKNSRAGFSQRMLYYTIFPIFAIPFLFFLSLVVHCVITVSPPTSTLLPGLVAKVLRKKWVVDVTDLWHEEAAGLEYINMGNPLLGISKELERLSLAKCHLIITATLAISDYVEMKLSTKRCTRVTCMPTLISSFRSIKCEKKRQLVYTGNISKPQALHVIVSAMEEVVKKFQDLKLLIVGKGDKEEELRELVKMKRLENNIEFLGFIRRSDIPLLLSESIIGLVPLADRECLSYAIPTKTYEYMACGLPFIGYGGSNELEKLTTESGAGIYVRGEDHEYLAKCLVDLLSNPAELDKMSILARNYMERGIPRIPLKRLHECIDQ